MANQITVESEAPQSMDEYNREMASKATFAENTIDQGVVPLEEPEVVDETFRPEKFQSDEEWRKSYDELERNFHSPSPEQEQEELSIPQATQDAPFDMEALSKEYMETGGLKDASYKLLEDAGISKTNHDNGHPWCTKIPTKRWENANRNLEFLIRVRQRVKRAV